MNQNDTLLFITPLSGASGLTLTPYSARGITQTLEPIKGTGRGGAALGTWIRESTNGVLIDLTYAPFRKLESIVTCTETETPCMNDAWLGQVCSVQCACERSYHTIGGSPDRPEVSGSSRTQGAFTYYRPELIMMVTDIRSGFAEYKADYAWQIDLREYSAP